MQERVAFFIRAYNDVDHFTPLLAEFIKRNENPLVILNTDFEFDGDYRIEYLKSLGAYEVYRDVDHDFIRAQNRNTFISKLSAKIYAIKRNRKGLVGRLYRRLFFNCRREMDYLREKDIGVCVFEWSTPFARGEKVEKYFFAAKAIGLKTLAIPHGCNIFINNDVTIGYRAILSRGEFVDQKDTQYFDYYVLQNPRRRDGWIKWGFNPTKTQAWGSLRFFPEWADINRSICPSYDPPAEFDDRVKLVFMQFQKEYNLHNELVMETLKQLSQLDYVALAVKDATREGKAFFERGKAKGELGEALVGWYGNEVHSPSLIQWADCVVVIGGSIGIEAMLQNKVLIYPLYLNSNQTMYEYFNAAHCVDSFAEIENILSRMKAGKELPKTGGESEMLKEIVYAGKEPFNVPEVYYDVIKDRNLQY